MTTAEKQPLEETPSPADHQSSPPEMMSGAALVMRALADLKVEVIFGYPGGAVLPLYDELFRQSKIKHILVRHEQAAVHAAEGYARASGKPGVVLVTSGPGATNAVTGITDAMLDSIPIVVLTGQVATHLIGNDAFQEADTVGITRHCSKHNYLVKESDQLARVIFEAFHVATSGRPGPVVVDLPKDIQVDLAPYKRPSGVSHRTYRPQVKGDRVLVEKAVAMLAGAKKPIIYSGGGVINAGPQASDTLRRFARTTGFPVTSTLMGLGAMPASDPQFLGMLGMHGTYEANMAMHACDVMLCVGARFDDRVTGRVDAFAPHATKIHIDIDRSSINKNVPVHLGIVGDAGHVLEDILTLWEDRKKTPLEDDHKRWWAEINGWRDRKCLAFEQSGPVILPQHAIARLHSLTKDRTPIISTEVGQHQMWAAQYFGFEKPNHWLTSGGLEPWAMVCPPPSGHNWPFPMPW
ncbi:hypothetical protein JCM17845_19680 [Iodidimonas gelatinilytica]|uniref:Acetolactate synthase n=1 Tax=Iodidimonas gelatinilytica TaxID=1236966 RepID=A0A5A7N0W8_9PROT|nr:biosynthetic-type acetolactate synthase large subunit [Iodidimonas gelatinilytica]GER01345.1 hypothetical protein JCM17845_19680 [Iodidimonas gelatinilytica]